MIGEDIRGIEQQRRAALLKADQLLPALADKLVRLFRLSPEQQVRELGCDVPTFVASLKDANGKQRNMVWAQLLVQRWDHIKPYKALAEGALAGACSFRSAYYASRVADVQGWFGEEYNAINASECTGPEERSQRAKKAAAERALALACGPFSALEMEYRALSAERKGKEARIGGGVQMETRRRWEEIWKWVAAMTDRPIPKRRPAFEWQVETVIMFLEDIRDAAEQRARGGSEPGNAFHQAASRLSEAGAGVRAGGPGEAVQEDEGDQP